MSNNNIIKENKTKKNINPYILTFQTGDSSHRNINTIHYKTMKSDP
jgi:hypothetical protein